MTVPRPRKKARRGRCSDELIPVIALTILTPSVFDDKLPDRKILVSDPVPHPRPVGAVPINQRSPGHAQTRDDIAQEGLHPDGKNWAA